MHPDAPYFIIPLCQFTTVAIKGRVLTLLFNGLTKQIANESSSLTL